MKNLSREERELLRIAIDSEIQVLRATMKKDPSLEGWATIRIHQYEKLRRRFE